MSDEYVLNGRVQSVGVAAAYYTAEDMEIRGMSPDDKVFLVVADKDDPGNVPMSIVWAGKLQIALRPVPQALSKANGESGDV